MSLSPDNRHLTAESLNDGCKAQENSSSDCDNTQCDNPSKIYYEGVPGHQGHIMSRAFMNNQNQTRREQMYGVYAVRGERTTMEDSHKAIPHVQGNSLRKARCNEKYIKQKYALPVTSYTHRDYFMKVKADLVNCSESDSDVEDRPCSRGTDVEDDDDDHNRDSGKDLYLSILNASPEKHIKTRSDSVESAASSTTGSAGALPVSASANASRESFSSSLSIQPISTISSNPPQASPVLTPSSMQTYTLSQSLSQMQWQAHNVNSPSVIIPASPALSELDTSMDSQSHLSVQEDGSVVPPYYFLNRSDRSDGTGSSRLSFSLNSSKTTLTQTLESPQQVPPVVTTAMTELEEYIYSFEDEETERKKARKKLRATDGEYESMSSPENSLKLAAEQKNAVVQQALHHDAATTKGVNLSLHDQDNYGYDCASIRVSKQAYTDNSLWSAFAPPPASSSSPLKSSISASSLSIDTDAEAKYSPHATDATAVKRAFVHRSSCPITSKPHVKLRVKGLFDDDDHEDVAEQENEEGDEEDNRDDVVDKRPALCLDRVNCSPDSDEVVTTDVKSDSHSTVSDSTSQSHNTYPLYAQSVASTSSSSVYMHKEHRDSREAENYTDANYTGFFCVCDGHGGPACAEWVSENLAPTLFNHSKFNTDIVSAISETFADLETKWNAISRRFDIDGGTTTIVAMVQNNHLVVTNVGDSECVLCRNNLAIPMSAPHNMKKNHTELLRVTEAGGTVYKNRIGHPVYNPSFFNIAVTRAMGDILYKDAEFTQNKPSGLIAEPETRIVPLTNGDDFIILACDGLWDVMSHQQACDIVLRIKGRSLEYGLMLDWNRVSEALVKFALNHGSSDNITVVVVNLDGKTSSNPYNTSINVSPPLCISPRSQQQPSRFFPSEGLCLGADGKLSQCTPNNPECDNGTCDHSNNIVGRAYPGPVGMKAYNSIKKKPVAAKKSQLMSIFDVDEPDDN